MRISLNWLKDYVELRPDITIAEISEALTMAGLEVEGIEQLRKKAEGIALGEVKRVLKLDDGSFSYELLPASGSSTVVALGSSPIEVGRIAAYKHCNSLRKKTPDSAVIASYGDLDFPQGSGVPIVFEREELGPKLPKALSEVKEFDDVIFTLSITPNRADALSHLGISRELSALLDLNPRSLMLSPKEMAGFIHEKVVIEIENSDDCPRYACRLLENVIVRESPFWLKLRLCASGIRPINNVVDVTNYVMLSRGQPMHAFDFDSLARDNTRVKIIVRRAQAQEKLVTLDGQERSLSREDVVVADRENPLALAGVMGGLASAISEKSTSVLLESAYFDPKNVRMTARRHGIATESSYRFERSSDPNGVLDALNFAARILTEIGDAKVCRDPIDAYRKQFEPQEVKMRPERAQAVLGMDAKAFDQDLLRRRFLRLGIETVAKRGDAIYFRVPTYRQDLSREIDLIEEAARMIGYDKVKETYFGFSGDADEFLNLKLDVVIKKLKQSLISSGFSEAVNYAFLNKEYLSLFLDKASPAPIELKNPLSDRYGAMRTSLIPGLLKNLSHNQRNQEKSIALFEVGTIFLGRRNEGMSPRPQEIFGSLDQDSFCVEKQMLAGVMTGKSLYQAFDHGERSFDFYNLKGVLQGAFRLLGFDDRFPNKNICFEHLSEQVFLHPGECSAMRAFQKSSKNDAFGVFGKLHPQIAAALDVVGDIYVFELDLQAIADAAPEIARYKPFSRYPTVERDVAFLVDESVNVGDIVDLIEGMSSTENTLLSFRVFDIYRGKNIQAGKKSIAISLSMQREDRTLTDEEALAMVGDFVHLVEKKTGAIIRS